MVKPVLPVIQRSYFFRWKTWRPVPVYGVLGVLKTGAQVDLVRRRQVLIAGLGVGVVIGSDDGV
ncbi:MAG TPA: hypothetical protein EYM57_08850 [Gammaproteobacteria bacterium]|nr:hypothetical protein [Gammaproteobacteria bacterium]